MTARRPPLALKAEPSEIAPPHSIEMEQCAIGAMLMLNTDATTRGMALLDANHFHRPLHKTIMRAIRRIVDRRRDDAYVARILRVIDIVFVQEELRVMGEMKTADDGDKWFLYLHHCIDQCPSAANIDAYISVVIAKSKLRYQLRLGRLLQGEIARPDADPAHLHAATQNALNAINTHGWCDLAAIFTREK